MATKPHLAIVFILAVLLMGACQPAVSPGGEVTPTIPAGSTPGQELPNPASVYCEEQGYRLEIRTATDGNQSGVCIFPDGSECDEWAFFRGECAPASQNSPTAAPPVEAATPPANPTAIPTPRPIDPADYQSWWTYTHAVYNFSIMLPEDWVVEEVTTGDALMNGHLLSLHSKYETEKENIRMTFRGPGEDARLWPTGVGQGEFIEQGTLEVAGGPARRVLLVCPTGEVTAIWYHGLEDRPNISRGGLEFGFIFSGASHCEAGYSLGGKVQYMGEMIIASLKVP